MVAEVFELPVGSLRAIEVQLDVANKEISPLGGVVAFEKPQRIHSELVMRAGTFLSKENTKKERHRSAARESQENTSPLRISDFAREARQIDSGKAARRCVRTVAEWQELPECVPME